MAFLCITSLYDLGYFSACSFFFSTQVIKYVSLYPLSDFQAPFYRKVLFVEIHEFHCELEFYYVRKYYFKNEYDVLCVSQY